MLSPFFWWINILVSTALILDHNNIKKKTKKQNSQAGYTSNL